MNDRELARYGIGRAVNAAEASSRLAYFYLPGKSGLTFRIRNGNLEVGQPVEITGIIGFGIPFRQRFIDYRHTYPMDAQWIRDPFMDTICPQR